MIEAAIECIVRVMYERARNPVKVTADAIAEEVGDRFGFVQGRDFTLSDIEKYMESYQ